MELYPNPLHINSITPSLICLQRCPRQRRFRVLSDVPLLHRPPHANCEMHRIPHADDFAVRGVQNFNIRQYFQTTITLKSPMAAWRGVGMPEMETDGGSEMEADTERWRQTQRERYRNIAASVMYRRRREMEKIYSKGICGKQ